MNARNPYHHSGTGEAQPDVRARMTLDERMRKVAIALLLIAAGSVLGIFAGTVVGILTGLIEFAC